MNTCITNDVKVSVETFYQPKASIPESCDYVFAYRITIENFSDHTIKLLKRQWFIIDVSGKKDVVEGDGVIGVQPVLEPGQKHQYVSGCHFRAELGKMHGSYLMERQADGIKFRVLIPEFHMVVPYRNN